MNEKPWNKFVGILLACVIGFLLWIAIIAGISTYVF
jgi:hypothetical protein